jgi:hypothetical protein
LGSGFRSEGDRPIPEEFGIKFSSYKRLSGQIGFMKKAMVKGSAFPSEK